EGEYRRSGWSMAVANAIEGLVEVPPDAAPINTILGQWQGPHGDEATNVRVLNPGVMGKTMVVGEKIRQVRRLAGDEAAFLKQHAPGPWKITMPGAMSAGGQLYRPGITDKIYTREEFVAEIAEMLKREVEALIAEGCAYIQLDSLHYVERLTYDVVRDRML